MGSGQSSDVNRINKTQARHSTAEGEPPEDKCYPQPRIKLKAELSRKSSDSSTWHDEPNYYLHLVGSENEKGKLRSQQPGVTLAIGAQNAPGNLSLQMPDDACNRNGQVSCQLLKLIAESYPNHDLIRRFGKGNVGEAVCIRNKDTFEELTIYV